MRKVPKAKKEVRCSGEECSAEGNAFTSIEGSCRAGIPASRLKELVRAAARTGERRATRECRHEGCACVGRFRFTRLQNEPILLDGQDTCVWWVAGFWEGTCEPVRESISGTGAAIVRRIVSEGEFHPSPEPRPQGGCNRQPCRALAEAHISLDRKPEEGIDGDLFLSLIDKAAETARRDADLRCPKGCACSGEFRVTSSGVERIRPHGRRRYIWWVGGYWSGACKRFV